MAAFAGIPLQENLQVEPVDREINLPTIRVDNLYRCRNTSGPEYLIHFEAVSRYKPAVLDAQSRYVQAIISRFACPVRSYLLLLTENGVPAVLPRFATSDFGDFQSRVRIRPVRLWRIPARRLLALGRPELYAWIPLTNNKEGDVDHAMRLIQQTGDKELAGRLATIYGLRYGKESAAKERLEAMTTEEIIQDSAFYHLVLEKGVEKGIEQGIEKGMERGIEKGERKTLLHLLQLRFGPLSPSAAERVATANSPSIQRWLEQLLTAATLDEALR